MAVSPAGRQDGTIAPLHRRARLDLLPYMLLAPSATVLGLLLLYPLGQSVWMSFQNANMLRPNRTTFAGLDNYAAVLGSEAFLNSLRVSLLYTVAVVVASVVIGTALALLVHQKYPGRALVRSILIAPWVMPPVVTAIVWIWMYDVQFGVFNYLLKLTGVTAQNLGWLTAPGLALVAVIIVHAWKQIPFTMITILAGLQTIPDELYEAASIDGATWWQRFRNVTLPGLRPVMGMLVLLQTIWTFRNFAYVHLMTGGGPGRSTETLVVQVYLTAFNNFDLGKASAIGVIILTISLVFSYLWMRQIQSKAYEP